jgi:glycolate oxidase FAD binding subunit
VADVTSSLVESVNEAVNGRTPLYLAGSGTKPVKRDTAGALLSLTDHSGIVAYEPQELVVTVRSGTPLVELEQVLRANRQCLPFEPPMFTGGGTVGGAVASGLSGPGRPWRGSVRDLVLGIEMINGLGEHLRFGGQVMKNVAGYDVSRLQTGAWGTLGVLLSVSLRVAPIPQQETTVVLEMSADDALRSVREWARSPMPVSATCYLDNHLSVRLAGAPSAVELAHKQIGGDQIDGETWSALRNHSHPFFRSDDQLWRLSVPPASTPLKEGMLVEWAGAQRWWKTDVDDVHVHSLARKLGGRARRWNTRPEFTTSIERALKEAFDPLNILNPVTLHAD